MSLTEMHLEILKETFNVGAGRAAKALEELIEGGSELTLSIPTIMERSVSGLHEEMTSTIGTSLCGVLERFDGNISGTAVLLYSQWESLELVKALLGEDVPVEDLPSLQGEALLEMGNIVLNACLSGMADMLDTEFRTHMPELRRGNCMDILRSAGYKESDSVLYLRMRFALSENDLSGHIGFSMDAGSKGGLSKCLDEYMEATFGA